MKSTCSVDGCQRPVRGRGYCNAHLLRLQRYGDLRLDVPLRGETRAERFWLKVDKGDGCWNWTGAMFVSGYGALRENSCNHYANRVSWELHHGPIPDGLLVCHHCDNRRCVRPDHLFLGTHLDNARDMMAKDRHARLRGERNGHSKLSDEQVTEIIDRYRAGERPTALAREYGIDRSSIHNYVRGIHYRHLSTQ